MYSVKYFTSIYNKFKYRERCFNGNTHSTEANSHLSLCDLLCLCQLFTHSWTHTPKQSTEWHVTAKGTTAMLLCLCGSSDKLWIKTMSDIMHIIFLLLGEQELLPVTTRLMFNIQPYGMIFSTNYLTFLFIEYFALQKAQDIISTLRGINKLLLKAINVETHDQTVMVYFVMLFEFRNVFCSLQL